MKSTKDQEAETYIQSQTRIEFMIKYHSKQCLCYEWVQQGKNENIVMNNRKEHDQQGKEGTSDE